ncbi:hypothetical protein INQ16_30875, partial [Escherichia coli]|nr:hypothetical protein [Escherichia coli]
VLLDDLDQDKIDQLESGLSLSDIDKLLFLHKKDHEIVRLIKQDKIFGECQFFIFECPNQIEFTDMPIGATKETHYIAIIRPVRGRG